MNKELINKLIERARHAGENAYCPYTNAPVGCGLLVDDNIIFGGCNIENASLPSSATAGQVAILKAVSEGSTTFRAIAFWSADRLPYPDGLTRQTLSEFCPKQSLPIIIANDKTFVMTDLSDLFPYPPEAPIED